MSDGMSDARRMEQEERERRAREKADPQFDERIPDAIEIARAALNRYDWLREEYLAIEDHQLRWNPTAREDKLVELKKQREGLVGALKYALRKLEGHKL